MNEDQQIGDDRRLDEIITLYHQRGHTYDAILRLLCTRHGVTFSLSTLRRRLEHLELARYNVHTNQEELIQAIVEIQNETNGKAGYRRTWRLLQSQYGIYAKQDSVRKHLQHLNPQNVAIRTQNVLRRRNYFAPGPNYIWHVDGYDKLKGYGFAISGCIDGFSRKIMWLECSTSNNNPGVILSYYLDCVMFHNGCPILLRTDCGTENILIAAAHCTLRGESSHIYGTSTHNQRIECWWSLLRKWWTQKWLDTFEDLCSFGALTPGNVIQKAILVFTFMELIKSELRCIKDDWNIHTIRRSSGAICPSGKPDELFYIPPTGYVDKKKAVEMQQINELRSRESIPTSILRADVHDQCTSLLQTNNWRHPQNKEEGIELYFKLLNEIAIEATEH